MADNLAFPIGFDLEEAVKKAGQEWNSTYADKLEKLLAKRAITVNLGFSTKNLNNLDDVKHRLAELKIEPLTPENKTAIKDLVRELKELAKAMEKVQKYSNIQTPELQQALANKANAEATHMAEKYRQANERVEIAKRRVTLAEQKYADTVFYSSKATREQTRAYQEQTTYLNRLLKRMATYWSVRQAQNFITSVREVTAQFELQKVSLGAIIQDQARANQLFSEIKAFALKSPASIMDLTKYTKQLAAYKIETDELFETTKKLTDISVGLSVSLDRVILAYGQVRARGALYSSEIRQFTEMGVPIVEELAAKLTKVNGQLVTSAQVLKMVEKGAISFELVKEVFDDMTSAGGAFYNMQERQGNTLFGMWQKLSDAASVMYDEIGNTDNINKGMKESIALMTDLMKNWRYFANALIMVVPTMLLVHNIEKSRAATSARQIAAMNTLTAATSKRMVAEKALNQAIASGLANTAAKARMNLILAQTEEKVAQKALTAGNNLGLLGKRFNLFGGALKSLSAFVATNFWTILLTGIALLTSALVSANEKANRLKNTLAEIGASGSLELSQSVQNFERLAKIAVESADGSKKQRDALDELHRTYKEMIPVQDMTIEKLRAMNGDYRKLTIAIEEYIRARLKQQQIDAVTSEIGADLAKYERKMTEDAQGFFYTYDKGATKLKLTYDQIQLLIKGIKEIAKTERNLPTRKVFAKALTDYVGLDAKNLEVGLDEWLNTFDDGLFGIVRSVRQFEGEIDRIKANETLDTTLGKYAESWKKVNERIENLTVKGAKVGTFAFDRATANASVKQYVGYLKEVLGNAWDESFASIEEHVGANGENMSAIYWEAVMKNWDTYTVAQQNAILKVQKAYDGLLPSDRTVVILREKLQQISGQFGVNMDITKQYLMNAGEDIETYAKRVKSSLEEAQNSLKELRFNKSQIDAGVGTGVLKPVSDEEIEKADNLTKVLAALFELISAFAKGKSSGGGHKSDPRLQNLKEEISLTKKLYDEYHKLERQIGATQAKSKIQEYYANTIADLKKRAKGKYGFTFALPFTDENLKANIRQYISAMEKLQKEVDKKGRPKFPTVGKEIDEAKAMLGAIDTDSLSKRIEKQLKELADRISRTKTAKEFYEKILGMTGDYDLAAKVSVSIYGDTGYDLQKQLAQQVRRYFQNDQVSIEIPVDVITADNQINYKRLGEFAEQMKKQLGEEPYKAIKKVAEEGQKDLAKTYEGYLKDLEKAKTYADKRVELARTTAAKIREIERNPQYTKEQKAELKRGYQEREDREAAKLEYDAFKDTPLYVQMFEDLEHASTSTLEMMKSRLEALSGVWGTALDPTQLKEIQSRMNEIDEQLRNRNPFKTLKSAYMDYKNAVESVSVQGAVANAGAASKEFHERSEMYGADSAQARAAEKELKAREKIVDIARKVTAENKKGAKALDEAAQIANDNLQIKRGELEIAAAKEQALRDKSTYENPDQDPKVIAAHKAVEKAKEEVNLAQRVSEIVQQNAKTSKTLKENLIGAANQVTQFMQIGADVAQAIGDTMEALGANEDDVQYFNDIATALGDITAGFQGIIDSALSLNVGGIISNAIGVIPNMVKGFVGLFSAGKVRKANKEIERQERILEELEYAYGRLEKAMERVFGSEMVGNIKAQQKNLQAQAEAYRKQAEAERSKGKKTDEDKLRDYENSYRETMDRLAELQGKVAEQLIGSDLASTARDFAKAWVEAYKEFGNTADAMGKKFRELVENMVTEGLMARAMERALKPTFDMIDQMEEGDFYDRNFWRRVMETADKGARDANAAGAAIMAWAEQWGYQSRGDAEEARGIAKSVGSATSEEVNANTAALTTQTHYMAMMNENVWAIRRLMEAGTTGAGTTGTIDYTPMMATANAHLSSLPRIEHHIAEIHTLLDRVVTTRGGSWAVNSRYTT